MGGGLIALGYAMYYGLQVRWRRGYTKGLLCPMPAATSESATWPLLMQWPEMLDDRLVLLTLLQSKFG